MGNLFGDNPDAGYTPETDTTPATFKDQSLPGGFYTNNPTTSGGDKITDMVTGLMANFKGLMEDKDKCAAIIAAGIAAGETFLLFKTEAPEMAVSQAGAIAQAGADALSGIAKGLGEAFPDVSFTGG